MTVAALLLAACLMGGWAAPAAADLLGCLEAAGLGGDKVVAPGDDAWLAART